MLTRTAMQSSPSATILLKMSDAEFAGELQFLAAAKLYELGRLSSGKAAELAGMQRVEFLRSLCRRSIFATKRLLSRFLRRRNWHSDESWWFAAGCPLLQFSHKALRFGAAPHGGIGLGLDRLVWTLLAKCRTPCLTDS
jgi:hypothetical protein